MQERKKAVYRTGLMCIWLSLLLTGSIGAYAADSAGSDGTCSDVKFTDTAGHWASEYIAEGVEKNWINGYPDGTFRPQNTITRAEFVKLDDHRRLYRYRAEIRNGDQGRVQRRKISAG